MPPRKSNISQVSTANEDGGGTPSKEREQLQQQQQQGLNIEDLSLPRTMIQRLAKGVLPPNTQLSKDAVLAMQKGATVFVNHIAAAANATAQTNNRRTIPPTAIFEALREIEYEGLEPKVEAELRHFNDVQTGKRNEYRRKLKEGKGDEEGESSINASAITAPAGLDGMPTALVGGTGTDLDTSMADADEEEEEDGRVSKRPRVSHDTTTNTTTTTASPPNGAINGSAPRKRTVPTNTRQRQDHPDDDDEEEEEESRTNGAQDDDEDEDEEEEEEELPNDADLDEGDEEEDDEDDEDEYPDEGRRLSSLEPDTYSHHDRGGGGGRHRGSGRGAGGRSGAGGGGRTDTGPSASADDEEDMSEEDSE